MTQNIFGLFQGFNDGKNTANVHGKLGEVVVLEDCSAEPREMMEGYLAWKWGLRERFWPISERASPENSIEACVDTPADSTPTVLKGVERG